MATTFEQTPAEERMESRFPSPARSSDHSGRWARLWSMAGAAVWSALALAARAGLAKIGALELMFLFAPLVIVPLGMDLGWRLGERGRFASLAQRLQPAAAALAISAMLLSIGKWAALAAGGWLCVCLLMGATGLNDLLSAVRGRGGVSRATLGIARLDLVVGGAWLVASRLGMRPMGIQEPIGLLTAVHFHFAGFATATIAAATLHFADHQHGWQKTPWLPRVVIFSALMPLVVAAGFVISPALKMAAGVLFSASVASLAIWIRSCGRRLADGAARMMLQIAAVAIFAGMVLSCTYAVADFFGSDVLTIPQMARTHGILNGIGFSLCGMLGWLMTAEKNFDVS